MINPNLIKDLWGEREVRFALIPFWVKALAVLIAVGFVVYQIYSYGVDTEHARWQLRESAALADKQTKILELQTLNRELERAATLRVTALQTVYERKLQDEKSKTNRIIAGIASGAKRLSISTKASGVCASTPSSTATATTTSNTETRAELSDESAQFLVSEASRADEITLESNYVKDLLMQCYDHVKALDNLSQVSQ